MNVGRSAFSFEPARPTMLTPNDAGPGILLVRSHDAIDSGKSFALSCRSRWMLTVFAVQSQVRDLEVDSAEYMERSSAPSRSHHRRVGSSGSRGRRWRRRRDSPNPVIVSSRSLCILAFLAANPRLAVGRQHIHEWSQYTHEHHQPQHIFDSRRPPPPPPPPPPPLVCERGNGVSTKPPPPQPRPAATAATATAATTAAAPAGTCTTAVRAPGTTTPATGCNVHAGHHAAAR